MFNIVLLEPEIPQNTGNIARTCAATGCRLHIIRPIPFEISDRTVKRAGLDYWDKLDISIYENLKDFQNKNPCAGLLMSSTKAERIYSDCRFKPDDYIMFGKETKGIPEDMLKKNYEKAFRLPMLPDCRSLNLSNSVAIVVYEAFRQNAFTGLMKKGRLTEKP